MALQSVCHYRVYGRPDLYPCSILPSDVYPRPVAWYCLYSVQYCLYQCTVLPVSYNTNSPVDTLPSTTVEALYHQHYSGHFTACKTPSVQGVLYCVHCIIYIIQYTVYTIQSIVYNIQFTVYSIWYTVYSIQYTVYSIRYTVYSIQYTLYSNRSLQQRHQVSGLAAVTVGEVQEVHR